MNPDIKFPIAEIFTSVHGEGRFAGTRMTFFRLAGCTVGQMLHPSIGSPEFVMLPGGEPAYTCTAFDGREFPCDTDFRRYDTKTIPALLREIPKNVFHVCITGGEPLMHKGLINLVEAIHEERPDVIIHIETSGTIVIDDWLIDNYIYIAISPKKLCIPKNLIVAGEIRLMVDENFDARAAEDLIGGAIKMLHPFKLTAQLYLAPLSLADDVLKISPKAMQTCMNLLDTFPEARVSIQMHKILGVR